jgi:hypothetical protein
MPRFALPCLALPCLALRIIITYFHPNFSDFQYGYKVHITQNATNLNTNYDQMGLT